MVDNANWQLKTAASLCMLLMRPFPCRSSLPLDGRHNTCPPADSLGIVSGFFYFLFLILIVKLCERIKEEEVIVKLYLRRCYSFYEQLGEVTCPCRTWQRLMALLCFNQHKTTLLTERKRQTVVNAPRRTMSRHRWWPLIEKTSAHCVAG